jgi:8-oxo-dGTP pyrophosphatase MutT (NUDIX family)
MSHCLHAVVGTLLIHQGRIATAMRQKPPRKRAPSAGHVDRTDGLRITELPRVTGCPPSEGNKEAFLRCAERETFEETGFKVEGGLDFLFWYQASDSCAKTEEFGGLGGRHLWAVYAYEIKMISQPTLLDEPGKMHDWDFRSIGTLLADPELEPIWFDLLTEIAKSPERYGLNLA